MIVRRVALYALVAIAACAIELFYQTNPYRYWFALTCFCMIGLAPNFGLTIYLRDMFLLLCLILFSVLVSALLSPYYLVSVIFIVMMTILLTWQAGLRPDKAFYLLIINFYLIVASSMLVPGWLAILSIASFILLAACVLCLLQALFYIGFWPKQLAWQLQQYLYALNALLAQIYSTMDDHYADNRYYYERELHRSKRRILSSQQYLQAISLQSGLLTDDGRTELTSILQYFTDLYRIIIDCSMIRHRIKDGTVYNLCAIELQALENESKFLFNTMAIMLIKPVYPFDISRLHQAIEAFETVYEQVLKITVKDPYVFDLMIYNLKNMEHKLSHFYDIGLKVRALNQ
jgi:hypothetical protein